MNEATHLLKSLLRNLLSIFFLLHSRLSFTNYLYSSSVVGKGLHIKFLILYSLLSSFSCSSLALSSDNVTYLIVPLIESPFMILRFFYILMSLTLK